MTDFHQISQYYICSYLKIEMNRPFSPTSPSTTLHQTRFPQHPTLNQHAHPNTRYVPNCNFPFPTQQIQKLEAVSQETNSFMRYGVNSHMPSPFTQNRKAAIERREISPIYPKPYKNQTLRNSKHQGVSLAKPRMMRIEPLKIKKLVKGERGSSEKYVTSQDLETLKTGRFYDSKQSEESTKESLEYSTIFFQPEYTDFELSEALGELMQEQTETGKEQSSGESKYWMVFVWILVLVLSALAAKFFSQ